MITIDPEKFALAVVSSSSPHMSIDQKFSIYKEAFDYVVKTLNEIEELKQQENI